MNTDYIQFVEEVDSTNAYLFRLQKEYDSLPHGLCIIADYQTKGKGQPGNCWEAEKGQNLLFSVLLHPERITLGNEFYLSQIVSLAIQKTLQEIVQEAVSIKWPNDIYIGSKKVCGILIENCVMGSCIASSVVGIGLNVNQLDFISDAPNPISLKQLTHKELSRKEILLKILDRILRYYDSYPDNSLTIPKQYMQVLYRKKGYYKYRVVQTNTQIEARICNIAPNGILTLEEKCGKRSDFAFKQIQFML